MSMHDKYIAMDLTDTVLLYRFLQFLGRWLLLLVAISAVLLLLFHSILVFTPLVLAALSYVAVRHFPSRWLCIWIRVLVVAAVALATWIFWKLAVSGAVDSKSALEGVIRMVILWSLIAVFFWVCRQVVKRQDLTPDDWTILDASVPFATEPSFADIWLAGGPRTGYLLLILCIFFTAFLWSTTYALSAIGVASVLVTPWVFVPVLRCVQSEFPVRLLRAIDSNRSHAPFGSYRSFVFGTVYMRLVSTIRERPVSILWAAGSALLLVAAVWSVVIFEPHGNVDPRAIPSYVLLILGLLCFYKSHWSFRRPLTLHEITRPSITSVLKLLRLRGANLPDWIGDLSLTEFFHEPFILYLRSFSDDPFEVLRDGFAYRLLAVSENWGEYRYVSLEKVIAETVWPFGKVVALGEPGRAATASGMGPEAVLRVVVRNDWEKYAEIWIREAKHVLLTVGGTAALRWEFQHLAGSDAWEKLTLILRHDRPTEMVRAWRQLCADCSWLLCCPDDVVGRSVAVRFRAEGNVPIFLTVRRHSVASYKVALNTCLLPRDQFTNCQMSARQHTQCTQEPKSTSQFGGN